MPDSSESTRQRAADYAAAVQEKNGLVRDELAQLGVESAYHGLTPCPSVEGFRGNARFSIEDSNGAPTLWGLAPDAGPGPFKQTCWLLPEFARTIAFRIFQQIVATGNFPGVNGFDLRIAHGSEEAHVTLAAQKAHPVNLEAISMSLLETIDGLIGAAIPSRRFEAGVSELPHQILDRTILQHHSAFFQNNLHLTPRLAAAVRKQLGEDPIESLVDLYCGVGLHSMFASDKASRVIGADNHPLAIASAKDNAVRAGLQDATFLCRSADDFAADRQGLDSPVVVINPPRSGCGEEVIKGVCAWRPKRIVIVSCCLETQLNDLRAWLAREYVAHSISAFDMFPFTRFVETVATLTSPD